MATLRLLRPTKTTVVDPHNEYTEAREPTVSYDSEVQITVKYDFCEILDRDKFDGNTVGKGEFHNIVTRM